MNTLSWDGGFAGGGLVPAGVYFLSVHAGVESGKARISVLR
jgi:hypothetical protein